MLDVNGGKRIAEIANDQCASKTKKLSRQTFWKCHKRGNIRDACPFSLLRIISDANPLAEGYPAADDNLVGAAHPIDVVKPVAVVNPVPYAKIVDAVNTVVPVSIVDGPPQPKKDRRKCHKCKQTGHICNFCPNSKDNRFQRIKHDAAIDPAVAPGYCDSALVHGNQIPSETAFGICVETGHTSHHCPQ
ncbi:hypothetical protein GQ43DRAFT_439730 [Delitschia confertaspora ATCC 74209]|uniref:CCHC-type domain-containing protein n=1 Tax=Delitschia confertaspora ATCC 74209 TaxID=1513339 RepID=A0A9P4JQ82_9PLEO|nr:hypothetical protein GQ43DRAFT_439730 [Delitschia confertaspora ATCC 74209]